MQGVRNYFVLLFAHTKGGGRSRVECLGTGRNSYKNPHQQSKMEFKDHQYALI